MAMVYFHDFVNLGKKLPLGFKFLFNHNMFVKCGRSILSSSVLPPQCNNERPSECFICLFLFPVERYIDRLTAEWLTKDGDLRKKARKEGGRKERSYKSGPARACCSACFSRVKKRRRDSPTVDAGNDCAARSFPFKF